MLNENHKIEDIKSHLYDRKDTISQRKKEGVIHRINHQVLNSWKNENENAIDNNMIKPKTSIFKKFFILSIIFFVGASAIAFYMFSSGNTSVSNDKIDITVIGNAFTKGGEELPLQIEIVNRNKASLELSNLQISYPKGATDNLADYTRLPRIDIGTIAPGETVIKNIKVVLFGDERSNRNIKIELDYHPEGSNAIFTKEKEYSVNISSSPVSILIDAPNTVTSDQVVTVNIKAVLNTSLPDKNTILEVTYPNNFIYESAIPVPSYGNSIWSLDKISLTNPIPISIKGRIIGQDNDQQVFRIFTGISNSINNSKVDIVYNSILHTTTITRPFLEARISVNDFVSPGEKVRVKIQWANNMPNRITDAEIIVNLSGNVYDKSTISSTSGFFESYNNRIIWNKNYSRDLAEIEPGERGEVDFTMQPLSNIGILNSITNPQIAVEVSIKGRQPSLGSTYTDIDNFSKKIIKISTDYQIYALAFYKSGAFPPKAETETIYNINWSLINSTNEIKDSVARAELPIYVKWVGSLSPRENITYNEVTREVIWKIGSVKPNTGSINNREAIFSVSLTPSFTQIGSVPQLVKEIYLSGTDIFTGMIVNKKRNSLNTQINEDPNYKNGYDKVIE